MARQPSYRDDEPDDPQFPGFRSPAQPAAPIMPRTGGYDPGAVPEGLMPIPGDFRRRQAELNFRGNQLARQQDVTNQANYLQSLPQSNNPLVNAGRAQWIARDRAQARGMTPYFDQQAYLVGSADQRANDYNAGQVGIFNSVAGVNNANAANTTYQMPYIGALSNAQAAAFNAYSRRMNLMTPGLVTQQDLANDRYKQMTAFPGFFQSQIQPSQPSLDDVFKASREMLQGQKSAKAVENPYGPPADATSSPGSMLPGMTQNKDGTFAYQGNNYRWDGVRNGWSRVK